VRGGPPRTQAELSLERATDATLDEHDDPGNVTSNVTNPAMHCGGVSDAETASLTKEREVDRVRDRLQARLVRMQAVARIEGG
jgi:hypothetical protein